MLVFRHYHDLPEEARGAVVAIGNFDGIHRGHQAVIGKAGRLAWELEAPHGVLTFEPHPRAGARAVQMLRLVGALKILRRRDEADPESDLLARDDETVRECVVAYLKLLSELAVPIVAVEGADPLRRRFERVLEETSHRFPALMVGLRVGPQATLDALEPLLLEHRDAIYEEFLTLPVEL